MRDIVRVRTARPLVMTPLPHLPPSSRRVKELLDSSGGMTHKDIVTASNLSPRTVRYALKVLKEKNLLVEKFNFRDARRTIYLDKAQWNLSHPHASQQSGNVMGYPILQA